MTSTAATEKDLGDHYLDEFQAMDLSFTAPAATSYTCPTCECADHVERISTEVVCTQCGTLVDIPLEWSAEYRFYSADAASTADPSRCSFPVNHLMPESSLGTIIQTRGAGSATSRRIRRYHMWNLMPYRERTLWSVFESLQVRATNAGISTAVIEESKELYAQLTASTVCRGQPQRDAMLAACLWEALKRHESPRLPRDIAEIFHLPLQHVTRGIKQFQHTLAFRTSAKSTDTYVTAISVPAAASAAPTHPVAEAPEVVKARAIERRAAWRATVARTTSYEDFIIPFLTNLSVPREVSATLEATVRHVCARIEELGVVPENTPPSLTASVIAFVSTELGIRIEHADLARVCGISAVTIAKCLKRMAPWREKLLAENPSGQ
jgi:transcription initiation factor TFIIIB Brf1 subunit/transcription initiation factor TFIIB